MKFNISFIIIFLVIFSIVVFFIDSPFFLDLKIKPIPVGFIIIDYGVENFEHLVVSKILKTESILNVKYTIIKTKNYEEQKKAAYELLKNNVKIIIFYNGTALQNFVIDLAKNNKKNIFILIDSTIRSNLENLFVINYDYFHLGFLSGILASIASKNGKVAFIGGIDYGSILELKKGVEYAINLYNNIYKTNIKFYYSFINKSPEFSAGTNPFSSPALAKNIALDLHKNYRVDIIIAAAGNSNSGVYEYSKLHEFKIINFDSTNVKILAEKNVIFSIIRNIDNCVISVLDNILKKNTTNKNYIFDISHNSFSIISAGAFELTNDDYIKIDLIKNYLLENYEN